MLQLREHREAQGLTQEALAYSAGVSYKTVARIEQLRTASSRSLVKIAAALNVEVGDLFAPPKRNGRKRRSA